MRPTYALLVVPDPGQVIAGLQAGAVEVLVPEIEAGAYQVGAVVVIGRPWGLGLLHPAETMPLDIPGATRAEVVARVQEECPGCSDFLPGKAPNPAGQEWKPLATCLDCKGSGHIARLTLRLA